MQEPLDCPLGAHKITTEMWVDYTYASHAAANAHFRSLGCPEVDVLPDHSPKDLIAALTPMLKACTPFKMIVDLTPKCPTTPSGRLMQWIRTLQSAKANSKEHPDVMFLCCRTEQNNPAYMHTLGYGSALEAQMRGVDLSTHNPFASQAVAAIIFFRDRELCLPARVACGSAAIAADAIATMLGIGHHGFACGLCNAPFIKWTLNQTTGSWQQSIDNFLLTDCDHLFHAHCIVGRVQKGEIDSGKCPWCETRLPWSLVPGEPQPTPSDTQDAASSQRAIYNEGVLKKLPHVKADLRSIL